MGFGGVGAGDEVGDGDARFVGVTQTSARAKPALCLGKRSVCGQEDKYEKFQKPEPAEKKPHLDLPSVDTSKPFNRLILS